MHDMPYHEAVGLLMYAAIATCPDIAFAVQTISCFSKNPSPKHWEAVKQIFHYLKETKELWLTYGREGQGLVSFTDADGNTYVQELTHSVRVHFFN